MTSESDGISLTDHARTRYIPQFDFIKGIAAVSVILLHAGIGLEFFSPYWIGLSVPLFICVSSALNYLSLSRDNSVRGYFTPGKFKKMFFRVFLPFISAQVLILVLRAGGGSFSVGELISGGGIGPGSYYPWIFLQLWFAAPFMFLLIRRNFIAGSVIIIAVSLGVNIIFSAFSHADWLQLPFINDRQEAFTALYRLCASRYLFIYPLIFLIVEKRIKYNILLFCAFISAGFIFAVSYKDINLEPVIFTSGWQAYEFPGVFYTITAFIFLYKIYDHTPCAVKRILSVIGKKSWEIFNFQMVYFTFSGHLGINKYLIMVLGLFICIMPVCTYEFMKKPLEIK
jgi:hypothetical protein